MRIDVGIQNKLLKICFIFVYWIIFYSYK